MSLRRKLLAVFICGFVLMVFWAAQSSKRVYAEDAIAPLTMPGPVTGTINSQGELWYSVRLNAYRTFYLTAEGAAKIELKMNTATTSNVASSSASTVSYTYISSDSELYYVRITGAEGDQVTLTSWDGSSMAAAYSLANDGGNLKAAGNYQPLGESGYYKAYLQAGKQYWINSNGYGFIIQNFSGKTTTESISSSLLYGVGSDTHHYDYNSDNQLASDSINQQFVTTYSTDQNGNRIKKRTIKTSAEESSLMKPLLIQLKSSGSYVSS